MQSKKPKPRTRNMHGTSFLLAWMTSEAKTELTENSSSLNKQEERESEMSDKTNTKRKKKDLLPLEFLLTSCRWPGSQSHQAE